MLPTLTRPTGRFPMFGLRSELDRVLEDFFRVDGEPGALAPSFVPAVDVRETPTHLVVEVEVPGLATKEIDVQVRDGALYLRGERRQEKEEKGSQWHRSERFWGRFERRVALPDFVDFEKAEASCKDGVLTVTLPRRADSLPKSFSIKVK